MFCPKCATQNNEGAKFCRSCGSDISLVPQAMTGQLQNTLPDEIEDDRESRRSRSRGKRSSLDKGMRNAFMGLAFLLVALVLSNAREGRGWWYWMLIPGFMMIGGGVAEYIRWRSARTGLPLRSIPTPATIQGGSPIKELPPRSTSELVAPPPSVTEGTTRHLGAEVPTKIFAPAERPKHE